MRTTLLTFMSGACLLFYGCSSDTEKQNSKADSQSQNHSTALGSHKVADPAAGSAKEVPASAELTLHPSSPDAAAAESTTTADAASPSIRNETFGATTSPVEMASTSEETSVALGGGNDPNAATSEAPASSQSPTVDFAKSPSPYLRQASKSQVRWQPFAPATFAMATQQQKPVLIDIGTNWNHLCRVMAAEAYETPAIVQVLNEKFVCVKVDGDLQPDIALRYNNAYRLINSRNSEYPLTVFALSDGRPFDILSFVPASTQGDQTGMTDLLQQVQELFSKQIAQVTRQAELIEQKLAKPAAARTTAELDPGALRQSAARMAKAPEGSLVDNGAAVAMYLLHLYSDSGDKVQLEQASKILLDHFRSPLRDQVLGGYFHPAITASVPRFEKLLPVQSSLLSANVLAFAAGKKALHKEAAEEILRFLRDTLEIQGGGFYASQDADSAANDDGAYFTWSRDEVYKLAGETPEAKVFAQYLNAGDTKRPLYVTQKLQAAADANGVSYENALKALKDIRNQLREARMRQENVPFVNKAVYASWNAEAIGAYLDAFKYLNDTAARDFALQSADFVINNMVSPKHGVAHVFYKGQASEYGLLEDNAKFAAALMQCFEVSGMREYLESAESIMSYVEKRFADKETGLYADRLPTGQESGLQKLVLYPTEDALLQSANAAAVQTWYALYQATAKEEYREKADRIVRGGIARTGLETAGGASFGRMTALVASGAPKVLIIAAPDDATAREMHLAALPVFRMGKLVERMTPEEAAKTDYPPAKDGGAIAYVCTAKNCAPPVRDASKVAELVKSFGRASAPKADTADVAVPAAEAAKETSPEKPAPKETM